MKHLKSNLSNCYNTASNIKNNCSNIPTKSFSLSKQNKGKDFPNISLESETICFNGSSIAHHMSLATLVSTTGAKVKMKKAYGTIRDPAQKFPESNFSEVVPK